MKKQFSILMLLGAFVLFLASCKSGSEESTMIPSSAPFIAALDMGSISKKVSLNDLKSMEWYKDMTADTSFPQWGKALMENPESSGVDISKQVIFFVNNISDKNMFFTITGTLKSAGDFEKFNANFSNGQKAETKNDVTVLTLKKNGIVAWKDKKFTYVFNGGSSSQLSKMAPGLGLPGSNEQNWDDDTSNDLTPATPVDIVPALTDYCVSLFNLKKDSSMASNKHFNELLSEKADVHFWQNTETMMKDNPSLGMLSMLKLDILFNGNYSAGTVNFEDGSIVLKQKQYMSKEMMAFVKKYGGSNMNTDMIKSIPSQDVVAVISSSFKPDAIEEFIKLIGADGLVNMFLQAQGLTLHDLSLANNGDMMLAITDLKPKPTATPNQLLGDSMLSELDFSKPDLKVLFSMGVKSKPAFQKLLDVVNKNLGQESVDKPAFTLGDKYFVAGTDAAMNNSFLAGSSKNSFDFLSKIDGHPFGAFVDIQKILTAIVSDGNQDQEKKDALVESQKIWKDAFFFGGETKGDAMTGEGKVELMDGKVNSLKQLAFYTDAMYKINKKYKATHETINDTLLMPPAFDTITTTIASPTTK